ncbi:hypothetical protein [Sorangium sp. So ce233]|uniref:hypothetical protein n=1 Tax=Sorangium sp. So ce233 TaxID=3133290 RepID=UPI003F637F37
MLQQERHDEEDTAPLPDDVSGGTAGNANERARKLEEIRRAAGIRPTVSIPRDPQAIADVLAALVRADIRRGVKVSLKGLEYMPDKGGDYFAAPEEVRHKGGDDCDGLTRAVGGHRGRWVGCVRVPNGRGFHVFLIDDAGRIDDPSVTGGMPKPPPKAYEGAARSQIRPPAAERLKAALRRAVGRGGNAARLALRSVDIPVAALARSEQEALRREVLAEVERVSATLPPAEAEELRQAALDELAAAERGEGAVSGTDDEGDVEVAEPGHVTAPEDVGLWDDVVRAVGTVASVVVGAVATPAAGAGVAVATGAVATAIGEAEKAAKKAKQPHPKDPKRSDAAAVHAAAQAAMKAAPPASEQAKAHAALAAVSSPDPKVQRAIRSRLATPAAKDPAPADRARLLAAAVALRKLNYRLPLEDTRPQAAPPSPAPAAPAPALGPPTQAAPQETAVAPERAPRRHVRAAREEEEFGAFDLFDFEGWAEDVEGLAERVGCPGTCAVR